MRGGAILAMIRGWLGVEMSHDWHAPTEDMRTTSPVERQAIDARLSRQQADLAALLARASLDELRSREGGHDDG